MSKRQLSMTAIFFFATRDDFERTVAQRLLHLQRFHHRKTKPRLDFIGLCQDDWHRLGMNCADFFIGICRQKSEQLMLAFNGIGFSAAPAMPSGPDTGEEGERAIFAASEPSRSLTRLGIGIFAKRIEWHDATVFRLYAQRTRFIPNSVSRHFQSRPWPQAKSKLDVNRATRTPIDVKAKMRTMWD
jgi:hypothetical protein